MQLINTDGLTFLGPGSEWFWAALAGTVTAVTFLAIYRQLRLQAGTAAREQLLDVMREWESERMLRQRLAALEALLEGPVPRSSIGWSTCNFWEYVGALAQDGHMNVKIMRMTIGGHVVGWWTTMGAEIERTRIEYRVPDLWDHFEWLAIALSDDASATVNEARTRHTSESLRDDMARLQLYVDLEERLRQSPA